nr:HAD family hydrolase [Rhizobium sp. P28RR-XV]
MHPTWQKRSGGQPPIHPPRCVSPLGPMPKHGWLRQANYSAPRLAQPFPIITRDQVKYAKPDPDLFIAAAEALGVWIENSVVIGDSVWGMLAATRCRALDVGLLSGGYGREELRDAGPMQIYEDPADLLYHNDEVGGRR